MKAVTPHDAVPRLELVEAHVGYDGATVLRGIDVAVRHGEFVGVIGPNGCGKSTLLRAMSAVLRASGGDVLVDGRDIASYAPKALARKLAVVSQETATPFGFTVEETVRMGRMPHESRLTRSPREGDEVVARVIEEADLSDLARRPITRLSGGERQRVAVARALAQCPSILLLDEATAHLDLRYQTRLLDIVARRNVEERLTAVAVMHDLNLAAQYCHRLILLHDGGVRAQGEPKDVLTDDTLREVYRAPVMVTRHPLLDVPHVFVCASPPEANVWDARPDEGIPE
ncbi:heme ABC transporter ATP-binding protein [Candidatus Poribacteria bacterium]|jgi:iron complex transport system ATP-binding protein|nr:heme ABC transporter ATP-binding protein [Candidatus Poribacteria bacterium]MBT5531611.1 heme ABC transporter ATP-binding protein [Candidatus Poribacteria bacterium]MBT5714408.1 heme ABC transporter ATP-binding protein [Candidatus Poribacteria bacterium]MBT7097170.1 heme ABC transporter ATP-binding protein [Candidatus Poribacteria bacterium]MBT7803996.1 heme ABC transporter ATP-binding protein [Candidatus Poribacteria bacterium]